MMKFENYDNHLPPKTDDKPVSKGYFFSTKNRSWLFYKEGNRHGSN